MNECWEKSQKCMCVSNFFSKPERTSWCLTPQLDTVIIEVSVKGLSLRVNRLRLYRAKHFPLINWTYRDTGFYIGLISYLNMKVLIFDKDENMLIFFKPLLTWFMTKSVFPSVTSQTFPTTWSSWAMYKDWGMFTIHKLHPLATHFW